MAGRVVLYCNDANSFNRPDSSRPQAARKMWKRHCRRVACAKRSGSRTAAGRAGRTVCNQHFLLCAAASGTGTAGEPPQAARKMWKPALPPGCVRGAVWKLHCGWPGGSGCIAMLPTRANVQTRAAPSGAENVDAALPPGCVREAEWKSAQPPAYLKIFRQIIATPASAMPIRHFTVIFSLKNMRHIISDSISEPP